MSAPMHSYTVTFLTPAFLGNAQQRGQWRTPPFKHLLREWWRVAWAEAQGFPEDHGPMRATETRLFGAAADDGGGNRSRVRLRLGHWNQGKMDAWPQDPTVFHPDVGRRIGAHLYLGYGPLTYHRETRSTVLKAHAAIQAGEQARFDIAFPGTDPTLLQRALALMSAYGALGGRSRNGWGSLELLGDGGSPLTLDEPPLRDWRACLGFEWAHAIGQDDNGALIWQTRTFDDWRALMKALAEIKIGLRTSFPFHSGNWVPHPEDRHWLSYPVTNHSVRPWGNNRLPNSLRFKVRRNGDGKLHGVIFHMPCRPPGAFLPDPAALERVWLAVHDFLDNRHDLTRCCN